MRVLLTSEGVACVLVVKGPYVQCLEKERTKTPITLPRRTTVPDTIYVTIYVWRRDVLVVLGLPHLTRPPPKDPVTVECESVGGP